MSHYLKSLLRPLKRYLMLLIYAGKNRYCPVCDNAFRKFRDAGALEKRKDAECFLMCQRRTYFMSLLNPASENGSLSGLIIII